MQGLFTSKRWWVWLVACLWLVVTVTPSYGQTDQWADLRQRLEQQQEMLRERRQKIDRLERPAQIRLDQLRQNVQITESQLAETQAQLVRAQTILKDLSAQLVVATANLEAQRGSAQARLRFLARHPQQRWWKLLLASRDLQQLHDRRRQLQQIYQHDRELLSNLKASVDRVTNRRQMVIAQENEVALLHQKLKTQKAQQKGELASQQVVVNRLKSDRQSLEAAQQRLAQDSAQLQRLIVARSTSPQTLAILPGTGRLQSPTYGPVSSPFGWRVHPILGYPRLHAGIDFAVETGTPIYAADTGTVILAEWYGGFGYTVIIDHGNQYSTLYAHCNELFVTVGQNVQKGQVIATVGSTGFSTGPHLHFELRVNGEPIDPTPYL